MWMDGWIRVSEEQVLKREKRGEERRKHLK